MTFVPVDPGISEGNYTEWTHKWTKTLPDGLGTVWEIAAHIDEKNNVIVFLWADNAPSSELRFAIFNISDFSQVYLSPSGVDFGKGTVWSPSWNGAFEFSLLVNATSWSMNRALQTYILILNADGKTVEVWRAGASALWSKNIQLDEAGETVVNFMISIEGKYILVTTNNKKILLYEGS